jgi:hypothetical protein
VLSGRFQGDTISFGGPPLMSDSDGLGMFLCKLDGQGQWIWSKAFPPSSLQQPAILSPSNRLVIAGNMASPVDFGTGVLTPVSLGSGDLFVAEFEP